jgi:NADPH:quinone reductase-like Zn-dependent oxidoreductase
MNQLVMTAVGPLENCVRLQPGPAPGPDTGQVLVDMEAANINLTDFRQIEGTYTDRVQVALPAPLGGEGVGRVLEVADDVDPSLRGQRVIIAPTYTQGTWAHQVVAPLSAVYPVGEGGDAGQMAMLASNPATAYQLLHRYVQLKPGDWVIQDMANSAVAQYVIALARHAGIHTINIVRRPETVEALRALGADAVLVDNGDPNALAAHLDDVLDGSTARLALDGIGGELPAVLMRFLEPGGQLISYSSMIRASVAVSLPYLVYRELTVHGFWVVNWLRQAPREQIAAVYAELADFVRAGVISATIADRFVLSDYRAAFTAARRPDRTGKTIFNLTNRP